MRFFMMMFAAFFALVKPDSTIAKPHCMKKTKAAPIKNQIVKSISSPLKNEINISKLARPSFYK
jgi:hypothetical protein